MEEIIRPAKGEEWETLSRLALESEAHWGYSEEFLAVFAEKYGVTQGFLESHPAFLLERDGEVLGFYALAPQGTEAELEFFYISPRAMGQGAGRELFAHCAALCRSQGIGRLTLVTSPQAVGFYEKMGARAAGEVPSAIDGRQIPRLVVDLGEVPAEAPKEKPPFCGEMGE